VKTALVQTSTPSHHKWAGVVFSNCYVCVLGELNVHVYLCTVFGSMAVWLLFLLWVVMKND